jgi:hypothetical protein
MTGTTRVATIEYEPVRTPQDVVIFEVRLTGLERSTFAPQ